MASCACSLELFKITILEALCWSNDNSVANVGAGDGNYVDLCIVI
jgi:hypothetical protein